MSKPRKDKNAGATLYRHPMLGFKLLIPASMQRFPANGPTRLRIGHVSLTLNHGNKTVHGSIPDAWMVDLNADSACMEERMPDICDLMTGYADRTGWEGPWNDQPPFCRAA